MAAGLDEDDGDAHRGSRAIQPRRHYGKGASRVPVARMRGDMRGFGYWLSYSWRVAKSRWAASPLVSSAAYQLRAENSATQPTTSKETDVNLRSSARRQRWASSSLFEKTPLLL